MSLFLSIVVATLFVTLLAVLLRPRWTSPPRRRRSSLPEEGPSGWRRHREKPPWVRKEVLRLKALMPEHGCRKIAVVFNHLHQRSRRMSVGKSYVASVLRRHGHEVVDIRRKLRRRRPRRMPRNLIWALDLTELPGGDRSPVLGLIDHGTRALLSLRSLPDKASVTLLRAVLDAVERFGKPETLRTDNEAVLTSGLFRFGLWLLGVRHQTTAPFSPWQNGRIEKLFGTFKPLCRLLQQQMSGERTAPDADLGTFRTWYNHVRPHDSLGGLTPAEAWSGKELTRRRRPLFFDAWKGVLTGFYFPD